MTIDYEAWRCADDNRLRCPLEGCTLAEGCARHDGWDGTQPGPTNEDRRQARIAAGRPPTLLTLT